MRIKCVIYEKCLAYGMGGVMLATWSHHTWGEADRLFGLPIGVSPTQVWRVWVHRQFQVVPPLSLLYPSLCSEVSRWFL